VTRGVVARATPLVAFMSILLVSAAMVGCGSQSRTLSPRRPVDGPGASSNSPTPMSKRCEPTIDDGLSPSYQSGSPVRAVVGRGHVLTGTVVSSSDCSPIANAKLELWPEYAGRGHPDGSRSTVFTDRSGRYRFECNPPDHIHMRISAAGYVTIAQNSYHPGSEPQGRFDVVLAPASR